MASVVHNGLVTLRRPTVSSSTDPAAIAANFHHHVSPYKKVAEKFFKAAAD